MSMIDLFSQSQRVKS